MNSDVRVAVHFVGILNSLIKHSFAHLEALLFLFVKILYEFRLLSSSSQKLSSLLITKFHLH